MFSRLFNCKKTTKQGTKQGKEKLPHDFTYYDEFAWDDLNNSMQPGVLVAAINSQKNTFYYVSEDKLIESLQNHPYCPKTSNPKIKAVKLNHLKRKEIASLIDPEDKNKLTNPDLLNDLDPNDENDQNSLAILKDMNWVSFDFNDKTDLNKNCSEIANRIDKSLRKDFNDTKFRTVGWGSPYENKEKGMRKKYYPRGISDTLRDMDNLIDKQDQINQEDIDTTYKKLEERLTPKMHITRKRDKTTVKKYKQVVNMFFKYTSQELKLKMLNDNDGFTPLPTPAPLTPK